MRGNPPGKSTPVTALGPVANILKAVAASSNRFAVEYGRTLPPVGFVKFCASAQMECTSEELGSGSIIVTDQIWKQLIHTNQDVNTSIASISDLKLYGEEERWAYPVDKGDCEDFVLLKKLKLVQLGFPRNALLITVVRDEQGRGHAVLTVSTTAGDYVMDNRRSDLLIWKETGYRFLERQSKTDPMMWTALQERGAVAEDIVYVPNPDVTSASTHH